MIFSTTLIVLLFTPTFKSDVAHTIRKRLDVSYASPAYKHCVCGRKNPAIPEKGRIIGGNETLSNEYPWMALIVVIEEPLPRLICGGSLISDQYVLTAAHCFLPSKFTQSQMKVVLAEHDLCLPDIRTVTFSIERFLQHPKYVASRHLFADLMLIRLSMRVTFNDYVRPICLPKQVGKQNTEVKYGGKMGDVLGWAVGDTINPSCVLRKTSLLIYMPGTCSYNTFHLFCAGDLKGNRDACVGDSGGPFQILNNDGKYELIGIVSSGIACGDVKSPGLYTDVMYALPWIYKETQDSMYCWR